MIARIFFINETPIDVFGESLGSYESGSLIHIKDYALDGHKIIATVPLSQLLCIEYIPMEAKENSEIKDDSLENSRDDTK